MDGTKSAEAEHDGSFVGGTDDPLEQLWDGGRGGATRQPDVISCSLRTYPALLERAVPPSEDVMAAWLYPIVSGEDSTVDHRLKVPAAIEAAGMAMGTVMTTESSKGKLPATDAVIGATVDPNSSEKKKAPGGSSSRKVSSATHIMAEKRRRHKIAESFRTLQQLVPGCDHKPNQSSTLDKTIRYMRSLQQQVQSMSMSWQASATAVACPVVPPPATVALPVPPAATFRPGVVPMTPFRAMLPGAHYHAMMMPAAAWPSPLYLPTQVGASAAGTDATGDPALCSISMEQQRQCKEDNPDVVGGSFRKN